jgi:hypothetical protein
MMSWAEKSGRAFRLDELPGLIDKPVGVGERDKGDRGSLAAII